MEYTGINGKANAALTTGIIGTALGVANNGGLGGLFGNGWGWGRNNDGFNNGYGYGYGCTPFATKEDLHYVQALAAKDSEIALLKSEQNTEVKIADVYERLITRINADARAQSDWNTQQMVNNTRMSSAIAVNANSIRDLEGMCHRLTKTVIPSENVCPEPMPLLNSWTAPTNAPTNA